MGRKTGLDKLCGTKFAADLSGSERDAMHRMMVSFLRTQWYSPHVLVLNRHGSTWRGWRLRGMHMHGDGRCFGGWGEGRPSSDDVDRCGRCSTRRRRRISVPLPLCRCPGSRSLTLVPSSLGSTLKEVKAEDGDPHFRLSLSLTKTATFLMDKLFGAAAATPPTLE